VRLALILILFDPRIEVSAMQMNPASHPHDRKIALEDEVLNRLLGSSQIDGSLLYVQQDRLNVGRSEARKLQPEQRGYFSRYGPHQHGHCWALHIFGRYSLC
jgi:hypothetical protein